MSENEEIATLKKLLAESNEMLRSANSIAERRGRDTNWEAFQKRVKGVLNSQHAYLYPGIGPTPVAADLAYCPSCKSILSSTGQYLNGDCPA